MEWKIDVKADFTNPFDGAAIALDMLLTAPSGKTLVLPCYFESGNSTASVWKARFTPVEAGNYKYSFRLNMANTTKANSAMGRFTAVPSATDGFILPSTNWTFRYSSGKPFRGIGENIAWEYRSWENKKHTYDYFLPKLAANGGNFFRVWMHAWNLPIEWKKVSSTSIYKNSSEYFNPSGVKRMDELIEMCDSLGLHVMFAMDAHGGLSGEWADNNYNTANGGPASNPTQFFTSEAAKAKYKNRLRYLVARWGYSPAVGVWEFFNEIDNAMYNGTSIIIPHAAVTNWHKEMSAYLKSIDPYGHMVSTSISHREITGLTAVPNFDFNMKHIYNYTQNIPSTLTDYVKSTGKPYVIGEFGYDWDWNNVSDAVGPEFDYDFKRGLWYGLFNPTPVLPLSWWWEFFDGRNMTPYFAAVREISDRMLEVGKGTFTVVPTSFSLDDFAVRCGNQVFVYLTNTSEADAKTGLSLTVQVGDNKNYELQQFDPEVRKYTSIGNYTATNNKIIVENIALNGWQQVILILKPLGDNQNSNHSFNQTKLEIPGTIDAENFDEGGEGVAFHDYNSKNTSELFRPSEGVDIELADVGYCVAEIVNGEWLEFSVDVKKAGKYKIDFLVADSVGGNSLSLSCNNRELIKNLHIQNTNNMWQLISTETTIGKGANQIFRLNFSGSGFRVDKMVFTLINEAPSVNFTAMPADTSITGSLPLNLVLPVSASDVDGQITKVDLYKDGKLVKTDSEYPYEFSIDLSSGVSVFEAVATDNNLLGTTSEAIYVTVFEARKAYKYADGIPIPGIIEAEDYDIGGEGESFHDITTGNKFNVYRTNDMDIEACSDAKQPGFNLGELAVGEWTEYTLNVEKDGNYYFEYRVATTAIGTSFSIQIDGVVVSPSVTVPNTGGWQTWKSVNSTSSVHLSAGIHILRFTVLNEFFNLNYISITSDSQTSIDDMKYSKIECYPNPASDVIYFENVRNIGSLKMVDIFGKVYSFPSPIKNEINVSFLPVGLYLLSFYDQQGNIQGNFKVQIN